MPASLDDIMERIDEHWELFDQDGSGELGRAEFRKFVNKAFEDNDLVPDERGFRKVFREFDEDGSGTISREEADEMLKHCWISAHVNNTWEKLDKDEDDALSKRQFRAFAKDCLAAMGYDPDWKRSELDNLMEDFDADGDGEIDMDEAYDFLDDFIGSNL